MSAALKFSAQVVSGLTGVPADEILTAYDAYANKQVVVSQSNSIMEKFGFDPASIIAMITAILQIMESLRNNCNKPTEFGENARERRPLKVAIFKARVWSAAKQANYTGSIPKLVDAMMDVAHTSGEAFVNEVVVDLSQV